MSNSVLRIPGKDTRLRRLALAKVRELRAAGMSYRDIGRRFHAGDEGEREHPAGPVRSPVAPPPSAGPVTTSDHWRFLCALDAVPVGLFFFGPAQRVLHANEPAIRMLEMDVEEERIRREIDAFVRSLCPPGQGWSSPIRSRDVRETAVHELSTAAGRYRLRASTIGLDLLGTGSTLLVTLEAAPPEPISPEAVRKRFGLTRKEAQIALLLAQRRSTPEIARELHASPHTVRHHVRHVLAKLGLSSRREVAAALEAGRKGVGKNSSLWGMQGR